jgi:hypothetical protein
VHAKYRSLLSALAIVAASFAAPALATVVTINANNYAVGTNVTNALSGVTLEYASVPLNGRPPNASTINLSPLVIGTLPVSSYPVVFNTLGSYTYQLDYWTNGEQDGDAYAIYMAFTKPVYSVTATDFSPDDDTTEILGLNPEGSVIGAAYTSTEFCSPATCNGPDGGVGQAETYSSTTPIASVLIGGSDDATYIMSISFNTAVPESPSLAIFAGGLLAVGFVTLRRKRRS